jgi:hypothetical protein
MKPSITPLEAVETYPDRNQEYIIGDMCLYYEGPMMSPPEYWSPFISFEDGTLYAASGEPSDPITAHTEWVRCPM